MDETREPDQIKGPNFKRGAFLTGKGDAERQKPIGDEKDKRCDDDSANRANGQPSDDTCAQQPLRRMPFAPGLQPIDIACGDHHAAR